MKQTWVWLVALLLGLAVGCGKKGIQEVRPRGSLDDNEVVIRVDQAGITRGQVRAEAQRMFRSVPDNLPPEQVEIAQQRILAGAVDNLITRQLLRAEMGRSGLLISQDDIEAAKKQLEEAFGGGTSWMTMVASAGISVEQFEDNIRLDIFKNKVLEKDMDAAIAKVDEEAVAKYYNENLEMFTIPEGRAASHILVRVAADADEAAKADARAKAEGIRKALLEGADFAELAKTESQCASRAQGGNLGVVVRGREAPAFEEAVFSLEEGALSEVVESPVGFHVILAGGFQEREVVPLEKVETNIRTALQHGAKQEVLGAYLRDLREKALIKYESPDVPETDGTAVAEEAPPEPGVPEAAAAAPTATVEE